MKSLTLGRTVALLCLIAALAVPQGQVSSVQTPDAFDPFQPLGSLSPAPLPQNPNEYVEQALEHELAVQAHDHSRWHYHVHREDQKNNYDRDVIDTSEGSLARTLLIWGRPLTSEERQLDDERMRKLVSDPAERAKHAKREKEDDDRVSKMLRAIPKAFIFTYQGEEKGIVRLSFVPNSHFDPPTFELRIFRSLNGNLYIDRVQNRLAGVEGTLFENVNFGWGLLGKLYKGGTFKVVEKDLGDGHWTLAATFFKSIYTRELLARQEYPQLERFMREKLKPAKAKKALEECKKILNYEYRVIEEALRKNPDFVRYAQTARTLKWLFVVVATLRRTYAISGREHKVAEGLLNYYESIARENSEEWINYVNTGRTGRIDTPEVRNCLVQLADQIVLTADLEPQDPRRFFTAEQRAQI